MRFADKGCEGPTREGARIDPIIASSLKEVSNERSSTHGLEPTQSAGLAFCCLDLCAQQHQAAAERDERWTGQGHGYHPSLLVCALGLEATAGFCGSLGGAL